MIGAIAGDIIGSVYEFYPTKDPDFPLFQSYAQITDDSVLTLATADVLLNQGNYTDTYRKYYRQHPKGGYGGSFKQWAESESTDPYNSWGNGSAMRISPIGWAFDSLQDTLKEAEHSSSVTHNHPFAIKAAKAVAGAIFLARKQKDKQFIRDYISKQFGYNLDRTIVEISLDYEFDVSAQGSVPEAIIAFLDSTDYESAVRNAVLLGGDADTQACIAGGIAEAYYGPISAKIRKEVFKRLEPVYADLLMHFYQHYQLS